MAPRPHVVETPRVPRIGPQVRRYAGRLPRVNDTYLDSSVVAALTSAHLADLRSARSEDQELKLKAG